VSLSREMGWSTIRDKIYYGDLDAAQSIAGMALSLSLGFNELHCEIGVPMVLNLHGNAVTLSNEMDRKIIGGGEGLKRFLSMPRKTNRPFTLAATHKLSSHHILLHTWLKRCGINPNTDVEIVFLPPQLMPRHLKSGYIDGYCVGEPWNSEAILNGSGWCPTTSSELSNGHPEKVLMMTGRFLKKRRDESIRLVAALLEACKLCQEPEFREELISILAMPVYTGASPNVLRNSMQLKGSRTKHHNRSIETYYGENVNRPTVEKASWVLAGLQTIGVLPEVTAGSLSRIYRDDLFCAAQQVTC